MTRTTPIRRALGLGLALGVTVGVATVPSLARGAGPRPSAASPPVAPVRVATVDIGQPVRRYLAGARLLSRRIFRSVRLDVRYQLDVGPRWLLALGLSTRMVTPRPVRSLSERGVGWTVGTGLRF